MIDKAVDLSYKISLKVELGDWQIYMATKFIENLPERLDYGNLSLNVTEG